MHKIRLPITNIVKVNIISPTYVVMISRNAAWFCRKKIGLGEKETFIQFLNLLQLACGN